MSARYLTNAAVLLLGVLVVIVSQALAPASTVAWVAFGVAIAVVAISGLAQLDRRRGLTQRALDLALIVVGGVLIGFTRVFGGATVQWLSFAFALGFMGLAYSGLTLREVATWRAEHGLATLHWLETHREEEAPYRGSRIA